MRLFKKTVCLLTGLFSAAAVSAGQFVSLKLVLPRIAQDQKCIWLFPLEAARAGRA